MCKEVCRCENCASGVYCSDVCRDAHVSTSDHAKLCEAIQKLEKLEFAKRGFSVREVNQVHVRNRLVRLIGEKPIIKCQLGDVESDALWDTGSMVSMVSLGWLKEHFPEEKVLSLHEFVEGDKLHLLAANNTSVDVEGVVILMFCVNNFCVPVPFIVCKEDISQPIVGYNVIKHMVLQGNAEDIPSMLLQVFPVLSQATVNSVISIVQKDEEVETSAAWTTTDTVLPPHSRCRIKCRVKIPASTPNQSVAFTCREFENELQLTDSVSQIHLGKTPSVQVVVVNPTNEKMVIAKNTILGSVETVSAVIPISPKAEKSKKTKKQPQTLLQLIQPIQLMMGNFQLIWISATCHQRSRSISVKL